ncbi:hypothetical protein BDN72DRAFT_899781 [Pluteus cervinus]|uniref:Uncharacterized protein n=1 Tax=Pluteus cervinus TaxID=181527 RepID=A0ACD3ANN1_9AGAR|nr:hypothetical protein BDN72DRAFT_899781 [Pluteus cervinus]
MDPSTPHFKWKIACLVFHILTMIITGVPRLRRRYRPQEDSWAFVALFCDLGYLITISLGYGMEYISEQSNPALFWASTTFFSFEICTARICLFTSILRLLPGQERSQQALHYATYAFGSFGILFLALKSVLCSMQSHTWPVSKVMQCHITNPGGVIFLSINLIYDSCLIGISIHALPWSRLNKKLYRFLGTTFFASVLNPAVGTVYLVQLLRTDTSAGQGDPISLTATTMALTSLLLCNLVMIASFIYQKQNNHWGLERDIKSAVRTGFTLAFWRLPAIPPPCLKFNISLPARSKRFNTYLAISLFSW